MLEPSSKHFMYFRAIQGHSGGNLVDLALQDNVLLLEDFTEYIYHVGNVSEIYSNNQKWIDPRRQKSQKGQAVRAFHCGESDGSPMDDDQSMEEVQYDLDKPRIAPQKILGDLIKTQCIGAI